MSYQKRTRMRDPPQLVVRKPDGSLKTKLRLANSIIISRLIYLLPIWGGGPDKYMNKVQIILNKTARFINGQGRMSTIKGLMESCKWLRVKEMVSLYSLTLLWKVIWLQSPLHLNRKINVLDNMTLSTSAARLQSTQASFRWRSISTWNQLPSDIRHQQSLPKFKSNVKKWILSRRQQEPD